MTLSDDETALSGTGKTILLVDDQPVTLFVMQDALESDGYQVITAQNGREALALYAQYQDKIGLVMTDIQMPDMDGPALSAAIRAYDASLPILFVSGFYGFHHEKPMSQPGMYFLQKPFGLTELLEILQEIFSEA